jgi:hypothetical protein
VGSKKSEALSESRWLSELNTSRINEELDAEDEHIRERSHAEAPEGFALFNEAMGLFSKLMLFYEHVSIKSSEEGRLAALEAHHLLMVDSFNSLRAAYKVLIDGYYSQVSLLLRRVIECALRMYFFKKFPDEALLYWKNPDAWYKKYRTEERLRKRLNEFDNMRDLVDMLRERYHTLSDLSHATARAMVLQVISTQKMKKGATKRQIVAAGGTFDPFWLRAFQRHLVEAAGIVLYASAEPTYALLQEHQPTWLDSFEKFKLAASKFVRETKAWVERQGE